MCVILLTPYIISFHHAKSSSLSSCKKRQEFQRNMMGKQEEIWFDPTSNHGEIHDHSQLFSLA